MATLGILGGMGPLASTEFLRTIYEHSHALVEQDMPACILLSDPTIPDRTEAILSGDERAVTRRLIQSIETLCAMGVDRIVIACVTAHHFLPVLPTELRDHVISLLDLIMEGVLESGEKHVVLCTSGTRKTGILTEHPLWSEARVYLEFPPEEEQRLIHELLYRIKVDCGGDSSLSALDAYLREYPGNRFVAGCTEAHLLHRFLRSQPDRGSAYSLLDPLLIMAQRLDAYLAPAAPDGMGSQDQDRDVAST